jgi:hypothetical protein
MLVQHSCDNRRCVNPDHLSLGNDSTNAWDKQVKGRAAKKLTPGDVLAIKTALNNGECMSDIAKRFGVDSALIPRIRDGHVWKHIELVEKTA